MRRARIDARGFLENVLEYQIPVEMTRVVLACRYLVDSGYRDEQFETVWWDRHAWQIVAVFPGTELLALAVDGRWGSVSRPSIDGQPITVTVRAPITGQELCRYTRDSPDGEYLIAEDRQTVEIVNATDGRVCLRLPAPSRNVMVLGRPHLVAAIQMVDGEEYLKC